jgi:hypothetical protein
VQGGWARCAADDGQADDARLSQTVGERQTEKPDSLGGAVDVRVLEEEFAKF